MTLTLTLELHWYLPRDGPSVVCQLFDDDDDDDYNHDYDDGDDADVDDDNDDDDDNDNDNDNDAGDDNDSGCVGDGDDYYGSEWECELGTPVLLQETV